MENHIDNLTEGDRSEFISLFSLYNDSLTDWDIIDRIQGKMIDINIKLKWLEKLKWDEEYSRLKNLMDEMEAKPGEVFVVSEVDAYPDTDYWPQQFWNVFTDFSVAVEQISNSNMFPIYYITKYRPTGDGTMDLICSYLWEEQTQCICIACEGGMNEYLF